MKQGQNVLAQTLFLSYDPVMPTYEYIVWSRIGHTPLTGRVGAFCDELAKGTFTTDGSKEDAEEQLRKIVRDTPNAVKGGAVSYDHPNQNFRTIWV